MRVSTHFKERWAERVGGRAPSAHVLARLMKESVLLQSPRVLFTPRGRRYQVMGLYWHPGRELVIKVDGSSQVAVTVLTPKLRGGGRRAADRRQRTEDRRQRTEGRGPSSDFLVQCPQDPDLYYFRWICREQNALGMGPCATCEEMDNPKTLQEVMDETA